MKNIISILCLRTKIGLAFNKKPLVNPVLHIKENNVSVQFPVGYEFITSVMMSLSTINDMMIH